MLRDMHETSVILISGIPGAGKSTVGRMLAGGFERGVHIEGDRLQQMIASGGVWPQREISPEAERQLQLRVRNACILADSFAEAGFAVVLDDVLVAFRLDEYRELIKARPLYYVLLLPDRETVRERNAGREDRDVFETWAFLDDEVRKTPKAGLWLDTADMTAEETVAAIRARLWDEGRIA